MPTDSKIDYKDALSRFVLAHLQDGQVRRLHMCHNIIPKFRNRTQKVDHKPKGLWYGFNDSWFDWCSSEMSGWLQPNIYEVVLNPEKVLTITNEEQFEAFEDEYWGIPDYMKELRALKSSPVDDLLFGGPMFRHPYGMRLVNHIDYPKLSAKYSALEITPYLWEKRLESMWYYGWDCESGCVWHKSAVASLRLFAQYEPDSGEYALQPVEKVV